MPCPVKQVRMLSAMKTSDLSAVHHRISRIGQSAARILARPQRGKVTAVFDRSIYCALDKEYVCIGVESLGICPLNVVTSVPEGRAWASLNFRAGMPVEIDHNHLRIGGNFSLKLNMAPIWWPPAHADLHYQELQKGLAALEEEAAGRIPMDGLGRLMAPISASTTLPDKYLDFADQALNVLKDWLKKALCDPPGNQDPDIGAWQDLLGLGPGLTPSGDDLIGGMMLALHRLGQVSVLRSLSSAVALVMDDRTNPISAAHLKAAMEGMGSETVHLVMDSILSNDRTSFPAALARIEKVGHTSGWDTLTGVVVVFRLWLEVNEKRSRPQ